jgi:hypothetical protein
VKAFHGVSHAKRKPCALNWKTSSREGQPARDVAGRALTSAGRPAQAFSIATGTTRVASAVSIQ